MGNWAEHRNEKFPETITPNMDQLVANGVLFNQFYTHKYCAPSRCSLQTGRLPIHVNVVNAGLSTANLADPISGMSGIPRDMTGIATKLKSAGYATHMVGKWDAGMATRSHIPHGRGYDTSLVYFGHENDYWTMHGKKCGNNSIVDLWNDVTPAYGLNNSATCNQSNHQSNQMKQCVYEDDLLTNTVLNHISQHDPEQQPFFLMWSPHLVHTPLEVPQIALDHFDFIDDITRRKYAAMVYYVDTLIGRVIDALKAKGMWNDLIWWSASDNGGTYIPPRPSSPFVLLLFHL
jgi:arylsulfatase I/J